MHLLLVRNVLLVANGTHARNNHLDFLDVGNESLVCLACIADIKHFAHDAVAILMVVDVLPEFFCYERHERMEHFQQGIEEPECCLVCLLVYRLLVCRLDHLKVPAGELVPEEAVNSHQSLRDAILRELVVQLFVGDAEHRLEPFHGNLVCLGLLDIGGLPSLHETESIPNLVVEVTSLLAKTLVEEDVITCRSRQHHTHANAVGAVFVYQFYRVGRVAETLRHLAAKFVAHDTCEVNVLERELAHVFLACHNHAGNPEEDDIGTCNEVACGIVVLYLFVVGVVDAVEERDRPQP